MCEARGCKVARGSTQGRIFDGWTKEANGGNRFAISCSELHNGTDVCAGHEAYPGREVIVRLAYTDWETCREDSLQLERPEGDRPRPKSPTVRPDDYTCCCPAPADLLQLVVSIWVSIKASCD